MVLPEFVPADAPVLRYSLFLCAIDVVLATLWLLTLTWLAHPAVGWLERPPVLRWSRRLLGATLDRRRRRGRARLTSRGGVPVSPPVRRSLRRLPTAERGGPSSGGTRAAR